MSVVTPTGTIEIHVSTAVEESEFPCTVACAQCGRFTPFALITTSGEQLHRHRLVAGADAVPPMWWCDRCFAESEETRAASSDGGG